ncbi:MAG: AbrB/MazE/SpoVT family DNA-binding domain-containing protein [Candidatus Omnitrophica bacterium]|nr:AbrB/MazE/SpoVT family DNA-binding domain-containing protein [Candidatus Omnitrophota bacterium]
MEVKNMTITMTAKHQITIPQKIADVLNLKKGAIFDVVVDKGRIELIPLETRERKFTEEEYAKLEILAKKEKGKEKQITSKFIDNLKKGKA